MSRQKMLKTLNGQVNKEIRSKLRLIGASSLFALGKELSVRVFTPPAAEE
jgi:ferritin